MDVSSRGWKSLRFERARGQVDAQVDVRLELADALGDHLQTGEIELDGPIGPFGGGEQGARVGDRGALGRTDQALVADRLAGRQREDRLIDRTEHLVGQDRTDHLGQVLDRAIVGRDAVSTRIEGRGVRPAVALAPVERGVGVAVEQAALVARRRECRDPDRQRERVDRMGWVAAVESPGEETARDRQAAVDIGAREQDRELVSTDPERTIVPAQGRLDDLADRDQESVSARVAALVVDALEVVDIDEQQGEGRARAFGVLQLADELLLEASVIAEAGQAVEQRILPSAPVQLAKPRVLATELVDVAHQRS